MCMFFNGLSALSPFYFSEIEHVKQQYNATNKHQHITENLI